MQGLSLKTEIPQGRAPRRERRYSKMTVQRAFNKGVNDYAKGRTFSEGPYYREAEFQDAWERGWRSLARKDGCRR